MCERGAGNQTIASSMDKRMCWLALCWWLGGCNLDGFGVVDKAGLATQADGYLWPKPHTYMTRWDKVNLDEVLSSKRLLQHYFNCLMSKGPCPPDGRELKRALPEALDNACAKCSKSQIEGAIKVIRYLREYEPVKFKILANKYDPHGVYRKRYLEIPTAADSNSLSEQEALLDTNRLKKRLAKRHAPATTTNL